MQKEVKPDLQDLGRATAFPSLTVVTLCRNNPDELEETLVSVFGQDSRPKVHLVIDSSDRALQPRMMELCRLFGALYRYTPPRGIYAGMRFGVSKLPSSGFCMFLNSGDSLARSSSLRAVCDEILRTPGRGNHWFIGGLLLQAKGHVDREFWVPSDSAEFGRLLLQGDLSLPHPSTIYRIASLRQVNPFGDRYKISADYATGLRLFRRFGPPTVIPEVIACHALGGISSNRVGLSQLENVIARLRTFGIRQVRKEIIFLFKSVLSRLEIG